MSVRTIETLFRKNFSIIALASTLTIQACSNGSSGSEGKNVFGEDDRVAIRTSQHPWSPIGKVVMAGGGDCTGTLVGKSLVLTAAHCVYKDGEAQAVTFYPNAKDDFALTSSDAYYTYAGTKYPNDDRAGDWAILVLKDNLGSLYGSLGVRSTEADSVPANIMVAGYSYDFDGGDTAGVAGCQVQNTNGDLVYHDCDMARGASGGPVIHTTEDGQNIIVGVNVAEFRDGGESSLLVSEYSDEYANIAIATDGFFEQLKSLVDQGY